VINPADRAYEDPDEERASTATPTEAELEREAPALPALDRSPPPSPKHDAYAALRHGNYRIYSAGSVISVLGHHMVSTALAWEVYDRTASKLALGWWRESR